MSRKEPQSSWLPLDLSEILSDGYEPERPSICWRGDEVTALFYLGKTHLVFGDGESGKTWLMLMASREQIKQRKHVFFFDFEDSAKSVCGRLLEMGCKAEEIIKYFHYSRVEDQLDDKSYDRICRLFRKLEPVLMTLDGTTEAMTIEALGYTNNDDIATFFNNNLKPFALLGAAVVAIDHSPHSAREDGRRVGSIGGVHKRNGVDVSYKVENVRRFRRNGEGWSRVILDKDRPGGVSEFADEKRRCLGEMFLDSSKQGVNVYLTPSRESSDGEADENLKKLILMTLKEMLNENAAGYVTRNQLSKRIGGNAEEFRAAIAELDEEGKLKATKAGTGRTSPWHISLPTEKNAR